jgi:HAE1 family hydrophobic/amphiphilic exporter-1
MFLSDTSIKRPVFTTMLIGAIVVFGVIAYPRIGLDMMPAVDFPFATVLTIYPGADPETVEREVSEKIEEAVSTLNGVRMLRSISVENVSQVIIQFELEVNTDEAVQGVRDKISRVVPLLPAGVETPKVEKLDLGAEAFLTIAVGGPGGIDEVTRFADKRVKEPLQGVLGVGTVDVIGGQEQEIKVWIDPGKLDVMGLTVNEVIGALAANNLSFPGGRITAGAMEFSVKVDGEFKSLEEIEQLKIMEVMGRAVRIRDVARVESGLEERRSSANLSGQAAVTLLVRKQSGTNTVQVGDRVKARLAELTKNFPEGYTAFMAIDRTTFTKTSIEHVQFDMVFGGFLAVLIVFLFLRNVRSTVIAAIAIPTSVVGTFIFINALGFTFNTMTMLALSLSIGILIDDAIVVLENIYRHMEEGKTPREAAFMGAKEIGLAVLATTMSIVAVFVPVAFMQGIVGRFFFEFGITVAVAVLISLFVAFTLTPMLCSRFLKKSGSNFFYRAIERLLNKMDSGYRRMIAWALRFRWLTLGSAVGVFIGSMYMAGFLATDFMPSFDMGQFNIIVKTPTGTTLTESERIAKDIATKMRTRSDLVAGTVTTVGADAQQKQNLARVYVKMIPKENRTVGQMAFMDEARKMFEGFEGAQIAVEEVPLMGGESGMRAAKIQLNVRGGDLRELNEVSRKIVDELEMIPGFVDLDTTWEAGKPEVAVRLDRARAANLGVVTAAVGQVVYSLVGGVEASKYRVGGEEVPIQVRLEPWARRQPEQIGRLKVRSAISKQPVALANLATIEPGTGPTQIDRQNRMRQITILGNLDETLPLGLATDKINEVVARVVPSSMEADFEGSAKIAKESEAHMQFAMLLAVILIYMVLASQFESFIHPFTIMVSLPLSIVGALGALLIAKQDMSMMAMIGIIMLMGLVTKNAILLIDYTNILRRRDKMNRLDALLKAGPTRLRPILMTTAAMVFGMLPIALSTGYASEMRAPMATCVIGGLLASTLLTLIVVPVVYTLFDDLGAFMSRMVKSVARMFGGEAPAKG